MASKRETILARVATVLAGTSGVSGRVYRSRVEALARQEVAALVIEPAVDQAQQDTVATLAWSLVFRVSIIVRGNVPDQLADPILTDVHSRLMADATLDGLVINLVAQSVSFEMVGADQPAGVIAAEFLCTYRTAMNTIT